MRFFKLLNRVTKAGHLLITAELFRPGRIDNLVVETSPGWWTEKFHQSRREGAELYASLLEQVVY